MSKKFTHLVVACLFALALLSACETSEPGSSPKDSPAPLATTVPGSNPAYTAPATAYPQP